MPPYLVVCNVGNCIPKTFLEHSTQEFEQLIQVNYLSAVYTAQGGIKEMLKWTPVKPQGRIVFVSSVAGLIGVRSFRFSPMNVHISRRPFIPSYSYTSLE
jgi:NAD(P)-dependent dehydrogenase (short-subunit alcohol dehydrogenase family)